MKDRTLILVRHAHRDTSEGRERDNGLSDKGKEQSRAISRYFKDRFGKAEPLLLASPKVRCIETLLPLADRIKADVKVMDLLGEQEGSRKEFERRVQKFFRWWKQRAPELVVASTHGDWIPAFGREAIGIELDLKKGGWIEIESQSKHIWLRWMLQKVPG